MVFSNGFGNGFGKDLQKCELVNCVNQRNGKGYYLKKHETNLLHCIKFTIDIFRDYILAYLSLEKTSGVMRTRKQSKEDNLNLIIKYNATCMEKHLTNCLWDMINNHN